MMTPEEIDALADAYFRDEVWVRAGSSEGTTASWDKMVSLIDRDPRTAWAVIQRLLERCTNTVEVSRVGSDPLESLIADHADDVLDDVINAARANARLREALGYATATDLPAEAQRKIDDVLASR